MKLSLLLTLLLSSAVAGRAADFYQLPFNPIQVSPGDHFTVDLGLYAGDDAVSAFQFDVLFPTFLQFDGITDSGYFLDNGVGSFFDAPQAGIETNITNALYMGDPFSGFETILQFHFIVTGTGTGTISLQNELLSDALFNFLTVDTPTSPTSITSEIAVQPPPPDTTPEPATFLSTALLLTAAALWRKRYARIAG